MSNVTSQAVKLLEAKAFKSYQVFPQDKQGLIDFEALSNSRPKWVNFKRTRVNDLQINPTSITLKGETLWNDSGTEIEKPFEVVVTLPISNDSQIQFL